MADPELTGVFRQPFAEQVAFFRQKLGTLVPTATWRDLMGAQHDRAFMVAGAAKADLLADLAAAVDKAISDGESLDAFRARFGEIVERHGWQGWTGSQSARGTAWRTRVIYRTNAATSYAAGRYAQLAEFPLWVYQHGGSRDPRPQHLAWDGLTLPREHKFWQTHAPPNGWGCSCTVAGARTPAAARRLGGDPDLQLPADWDERDGDGRLPGIDEGWDYRPGATWKPYGKKNASPLAELPDGTPANPSWKDQNRPDLRTVPAADRLPAPAVREPAPTRQDAIEVLARALGLSAETPTRVVQTPIGPVPLALERLPHMVEKEQDARERYADFILPTLTQPFEIYATRYDDGTLRPRFIGLFQGRTQMMVVVRVDRDGTLFWNFMQASDKDMNKHRSGALVWPK